MIRQVDENEIELRSSDGGILRIHDDDESELRFSISIRGHAEVHFGITNGKLRNAVLTWLEERGHRAERIS